MVFFRSEEHLKNWAQYDPSTKDGISSLDGLLAMFSTNIFKRRMDPDYFSNVKKYIKEMIVEMGSFQGIGNFLKS